MYELFGTSNKMIGISNGSDNGQCIEQNESGSSTPSTTRTQVDLNVTPPTTVRRDAWSRRTELPNSDEVSMESPLSPQQIQGRGVTGKATKAKHSPAGKSLIEIAEAMRGFTEVYKESKRAKQEGENRRTALLESMYNLKRRDMFTNK
ncbi:hypothetical protein R1flu_014081 [Riccia fluitans]|uniref:Uncharacterized protein n=1 Tax=Riccia fluitans TaxID=41844 RepID=A0ABD1YFT1_9MARC